MSPYQISQLIKLTRLNLNMSQDYLAEISETSRSTVRRAESGEDVTIQNLFQITDALGLKINITSSRNDINFSDDEDDDEELSPR